MFDGDIYNITYWYSGCLIKYNIYRFFRVFNLLTIVVSPTGICTLPVRWLKLSSLHLWWSVGVQEVVTSWYFKPLWLITFIHFYEIYIQNTMNFMI